MNHSICFADGTTHMKVLGLAVIASIVLVFTAHSASIHRPTIETGITASTIESTVTDTNLTVARDSGSARRSG